MPIRIVVSGHTAEEKARAMQVWGGYDGFVPGNQFHASVLQSQFSAMVSSLHSSFASSGFKLR